MSDPLEPQEPRTPTFAESLSAAARQSSFGRIEPGETPTAGAMLGAIGGVRGIVESVAPGFAFLVLYTFTKNLPLSVIVPVIVAVILVAVRAFTRSPVTPAVSGAIGIAITSFIALATNRAENNFLPGIIINVIVLLLLVVSIAVKWPLVGVMVGLLLGDSDWRSEPAKRRAYTIATWVWVLPSVIRVAIQVPLYIGERADLLAATKLLTGIPLYIAALWVTWLLVRAVTTKPETPAE